MRLNTRVGHEAVSWLQDHPGLIKPFLARLRHVCADELTLIRETEGVKFASRRYSQRCFRFADLYLAVLEWNHTSRIVHVHEIHEINSLPPAA